MNLLVALHSKPGDEVSCRKNYRLRVGRILMPVHVLLAVLLLMCAGQLSAQSARLSAEASATRIEAGATLRVTFTVEGTATEARGFTPPPFPNFEVLSGPNMANSYTMVNGRTTTEQRISYDLLALEAGEYIVAAASAHVEGAEIRSQPITIQVAPPRVDPDAGKLDGEAQVQVRLKVPHDTVFLGESVRVEVELYNRRRVHTYSILRPLRFEGLREEDLRTFRVNERKVDAAGQEWTVRTLQAYNLHPSQAGSFTLGPMALRAQIVVEGQRRRGFFFSPPTESVDATSDRRTITVLPLPRNAPPGFTGAVGNWRFQASYNDATDVTTADALTFTLYAQGQGDVGRLSAPELVWPEGWRAYPPEQTLDQATETDTGVVYTRAYEYTVVPQRGGRYTLAPSVSYFDASFRDYRSYTPDPLTLDVRQVESSFDAGEDASVAQDIAKLSAYRGKPRLVKPLWVSQAWYWWVLGLAPVVVLFGWLGGVLRKRNQIRAQRPQVRDPYAEGKKRLTAARAALQSAKAFYTEVRIALEQYAEDRLGLPASQQSRGQVQAAFAKTPGGAALAQRFLEARELADRGLYGGGTDELGRQRALKELEALLSER